MGACAQGSADGAAFGAQITNSVASNVRTYVLAKVFTNVAIQVLADVPLADVPYAFGSSAAPSRDLMAPA